MKSFLRNAIVLACVTIVCQSATAQTGSISGSVVDSEGAPVVGATIIYNNVADLLRDSEGHFWRVGQSVDGHTVTDADGRFTAGSLPGGTYYLCAFGPNPADLSSCEWSGGAYATQLQEGQALAEVRLQVAHGVLLQFQVSDPQGLVDDIAVGPPPGGLIPLSGGNFKIGILVGSRYLRAYPLPKDGSSHIYQVAAAPGSTVRPFVATTLAVALNGEALPTGVGGPPISVSDQTGQVVSLQIQ